MPLVLCIGLDSHVIQSTFYSKTDYYVIPQLPFINHIVINDPLIMLKQCAIMLKQWAIMVTQWAIMLS